MDYKFQDDKTYSFANINEKLTIANYNSSISSHALLSNVYTKVNTDAWLNHNFSNNNNTGGMYTSIKNNSGVDVAVFYNTKHVE